MGASALLALIVAAGGSLRPGRERSVSLTLQGAASLGTYEAAVNWTLIRLIRSDRLEENVQRGRLPRLEALSGSSAGSVNALLAAALWCEADDEVDNLRGSEPPPRRLACDRPTSSFRDPNLYTPSDGLFAASAFTPVVDSVQSRVFLGEGASLQAWMPCSGGLHHDPSRAPAPHGLRPAREVPANRGTADLRGGSTGVPGPAATPGCGPRGWQPTRPPWPTPADASGPYIPLRPGDPGAAGLGSLPRRLRSPTGVRMPPGVRGWAARGDPRSVPGTPPGKALGGLTCSAYSAARGGQEFKLCRSNFIDGGFLDNAPVGLAIEQAEASPHPGRSVRSRCCSSIPTSDGAGRASACAGESGPGVHRRGADGQRPGEHRARAAARRGHRLPALEPHHRALGRHRRSPPLPPSSPSWRPDRRRRTPNRRPWPGGRRQERGPVGRLIARCLRRRPLGGTELEACAATVQV